jgi:hypothetical protein
MANLKDFLHATLENGGATFNLVTGELNPSVGYMVALGGHEKIIGSDTFSIPQLQYHIADYIKDKAILLASGITDDKKYLGTWIHDGKLYLDISINFIDKAMAVEIATRSNQLAIWDCANAIEIKTD